MLPTRRQVLGSIAVLAASGLGARIAFGDEARDSFDTISPDFDVKDLFVDGDRAVGRRFTMLVPKHVPKGTALPMVVALHGLGEAHDEKLGVRAWLDLYGLRSSYSRLLRPPIARQSKRADFTDSRLAEVNVELARRPFRGLVLVCPFTPNVKTFKDPNKALATYADWISDVVLPRARRGAMVKTDVASTAIVGCSMGGSVALEVVSRRPETFGGIGLVQGAVSDFTAARYAAGLAKAVAAHGPRDVHLLTSEGDPFVSGHHSFAKALTKLGVPVELRVLPGPHDQPWLREAGSIEMLLYQDRHRP